jgi:hypothetical protein
MQVRHFWMVPILFMLFLSACSSAMPQVPTGEAQKNVTITEKLGNVSNVPQAQTEKAGGVANITDKAKEVVPVVKTLTLKHDNDICSLPWMMNDPFGQWIRFNTESKPLEIRKILIKGMRSNSPASQDKAYTINIWEGDFKKLLYSHDYPYNNFSMQPGVVNHDINPVIQVNGPFIVELISHSEWIDQSRASKDARVYLCTDTTVDSRKDIGISYSGVNNEDMYQNQIQMEQRFSHATWIIRVEGIDQTISEN